MNEEDKSTNKELSDSVQEINTPVDSSNSPESGLPQEIQRVQQIVSQVQGMVVHQERIPYSKEVFISAIEARKEEKNQEYKFSRHVVTWGGSLIALIIILIFLFIIVCIFMNQIELLKTIFGYVISFIGGFGSRDLVRNIFKKPEE